MAYVIFLKARVCGKRKKEDHVLELGIVLVKQLLLLEWKSLFCLGG